MALKSSTKRRGSKAISPAISTVIITGIMVALITVALSFASNFLLIRMAEGEYNSAKQFMQTLGLQIDDVAWIIGRTETARYSGRYGEVAFETALNYTISVTLANGTSYPFFTNTTGIVCFNMPVARYSVGNDYFEPVYPSSSGGFLLTGASAPVAKIFAVEKLPMTDGSFLRVVMIPTIRMLNLTIGGNKHIRLYLPILSEGEAPRYSQSVTLTSESVYKLGESITGLSIEVGFPESGFDNFFFHFPETEETIPISEETILELYVGEVEVSLGVHP